MAYEIGAVGRVTYTRCTSRCDACGQVRKSVQITRMSGIHVVLCDSCFGLGCTLVTNTLEGNEEQEIILSPS